MAKRKPRAEPRPPAKPYRGQPGPNVLRIRSSSQAKRDVLPIPKRGKR